MATILVVDDRREHRKAMRQALERVGHVVLEAHDGAEALDEARAHRPDLMLSDVLMPGMDGFTLCRHVQEDPALRHVPFVFMTGTFADPSYRQFADDVGAVGVLQKPLDPVELRRTVDGALQAGAARDATERLARLDVEAFHERHVGLVNAKLEEKIAELERANADLRRGEVRLRKMVDAVVETISKMVEYRDPYTTGHERRVGDLAVAIGRELGYDEATLDGLRIGGCLHDVGKIALPVEILSKPGRLNEMEMALVRTHAQAGYDILSAIDFPWPVAAVALQHHERLDGSGYPQGLRGEQIVPEARIVAVADAVEAVTTHRPYRASKGLDAALALIEHGRGQLFDPVVVDACVRLFREGRFSFG